MRFVSININFQVTDDILIKKGKIFKKILLCIYPSWKLFFTLNKNRTKEHLQNGIENIHRIKRIKGSIIYTSIKQLHKILEPYIKDNKYYIN